MTASPPTRPRHRAGSAMLDIAEIATHLNELLTPRMVAGLAGVKDPGLARRWARGEFPPRQPSEQRLRFAYDVFTEIEDQSRRSVAQAWAISVNPRLEYSSPVKAIREDKFQETAAAAKALLEEAFDG